MNVVLVGYGRMGREIEQVLTSRHHSTACRIDTVSPQALPELTEQALAGADGIIEFALAPGILERIALYARSGLPAVIGTTGWNEQAEAARSHYDTGGAALLRGSNFSVGAHLFFRLTAAAARLIDGLPEYDATLVEQHHTLKADYPSGTALTAAQGIPSAMKRKTEIAVNLPEGPIPPETLQVASIRTGSAPGVHEMLADSPADYLTIRHEARGRGGFALGAVRGLEWLAGRRGWFEAEDFIDDLLKRGMP